MWERNPASSLIRFTSADIAGKNSWVIFNPLRFSLIESFILILVQGAGLKVFEMNFQTIIKIWPSSGHTSAQVILWILHKFNFMGSVGHHCCYSIWNRDASTEMNKKNSKSSKKIWKRRFKRMHFNNYFYSTIIATSKIGKFVSQNYSLYRDTKTMRISLNY